MSGIAAAVDRGSLAPPAGPIEQRGAPGWDIPFVGRNPELRRLRAALGAARAGHGRFVLVVGDHGTGKTRLGNELAHEATAGGAEALVGRCYEGDGAPAFWPWIQMLRTYAERRDAGTLAAELEAEAETIDVAAVLREIGTRFPDLPAPVSSSLEETRFRFCDAMCRELMRAALTSPLVLFIDDLHAADPSSLLLLEFLAPLLGQARILVVGAVRDHALTMSHPCLKTIGELLRNGVLERVDLGGFSERDVAALIGRLTGTSPAQGLAATIVARTEGIPLFVVEVVRALLADGLLGTDHGPAPTEHPPGHSAAGRRMSRAIDMPPNILLAVACRLETLSSAGRELLALAAFFGREFGVDVLTRAAGIEPNEVLALLDQAASARIVSEVPGERGRYRFSHALLGETLVDGLGAARRSALHRRAADVHAADPPAGDTVADVDSIDTTEHAAAWRIGGASREAPAVTGAESMRCTMRCEGEYWLVAFNGRADRYPHSLGLRYLAELLWHPGRLVRAIDLAAVGRATASPRRRDPDVTVRADLGDAGTVIDATARAEYKRRLAELAAELEEAERANDLGRIPAVKSEIDALTEQLASVARGQKIASHAERARVAVSKGLTAAIRRIARRHPALGEHLRVTVKRGYSCTYAPDPRLPISWQS